MRKKVGLDKVQILVYSRTVVICSYFKYFVANLLFFSLNSFIVRFCPSNTDRKVYIQVFK
jgi:hypothetical protein